MDLARGVARRGGRGARCVGRDDGRKPEPARAAREEAQSLRRRVDRPHDPSAGREPRQHRRRVSLHARREIVALPRRRGAGEAEQLIDHRLGVVDARVGCDVLPPLQEPRERREVDGLDLPARLRQLAPPRLLEQPARAPANGRTVGAEAAADEDVRHAPSPRGDARSTARRIRSARWMSSTLTGPASATKRASTSRRAAFGVSAAARSGAGTCAPPPNDPAPNAEA